jgi:hypothetical protein
MWRDRSKLDRFAMLANTALKTASAWDQASTAAIRDGRISAILRAAGRVVLVGLFFGALACGAWVGMSWSADLSAPDQGLMDSTY